MKEERWSTLREKSRESESAQETATIPHGEFRCAINNEREEARVLLSSQKDSHALSSIESKKWCASGKLHGMGLIVSEGRKPRQGD